MRPRILAMLIGGLLAYTSCGHRSILITRHTTGTCRGACSHYLSCKERRGHEVTEETRLACRTECREVFGSPETIRAFEGLSCEETLAFVEGPSGREPGQELESSPTSEN